MDLDWRKFGGRSHRHRSPRPYCWSCTCPVNGFGFMGFSINRGDVSVISGQVDPLPRKSPLAERVLFTGMSEESRCLGASSIMEA